MNQIMLYVRVLRTFLQFGFALGTLLIARSEIAVILKAGFTPGFAEIIDPSHTYIF